ncbi:MAG: hypothetical protein SGI99_00700 [Pseudomonadota bacterium]|nr:hypothetical protein [Pseudomonadota bacterium]
MKNKSTRLSRWKAAMCVAVIASGAAMASQAAVNGGYAGPVVSPPNLNFGSVPTGTTSAVQTLTVSIAYGGKVMSGVQPKGTTFSVDALAFPAGYSRSGGTCPIGGAAPSPCTIGVVFAPSAPGVQAGDTSITASTSGLQGVTLVPVTGTGVGTLSIPVLGNLGLLLMLAGLGGAGIVFARRH